MSGVGGGLFFVGGDAGDGFDGGFGGLFDRGPDAGADAGEECDAVGGAFGGVGENNGEVVDVGLEVPPEVGACAAARGADFMNGDGHFAHDFEGIAHAEGDAFEEGSDEHVAGGAGGDADPSAAGVGIGVGAAFAGEIGEEEESFGAERGLGGAGDEELVGINLFLFSGGDFVSAELIAEPLEAAAGREHAAEDAPLAWDGMAHRMDAAARVAGGRVAVGEDDAAGAQRRADDAGRDDAVADSAGGLIPPTADDRDAGAEAEGRCAFLVERAGDLGRFVESREESFVDVEKAEEFVGPGAAGDVEQERAAGVANFGGVFAGHAVADVILGEEDVSGLFVDFGFVLADPEDFGGGEAGERGVGDELDQRLAPAGFGFDFKTLIGGALVVPEERGAKGFFVVAEED